MPDVVFPTYPFRSSTDTTRALRTPRERIADEISVFEFGSLASATAITATIQAAIDSGKNLYFPQGVYDINAPIIIPEDNCKRAIRGAGPSGDTGGSNGTVIRGNFRDFLWKTTQNYNVNLPISSISGMSFKNAYYITSSPITQLDPPSVGIHSGDGMGGLYLQISWLRITNCMFIVKSGVGCYFPGINNHLSTFVAAGSFDGTQTFSCGVLGSSCTITSGKVVGQRVGIATMQGPTWLSEMDIELCQVGVMTTNPIALWDRNTDSVVSVGSQGGGKVSMHALNFETCGSLSEGGCCLELHGEMDISNVAISNDAQWDIQQRDCHVLFNGAGGSIKNLSGGGNVLTAGILQKSGAQPSGLIFTSVFPFVQTGKPPWDELSKPDANVRAGSAGSNGHHFYNCGSYVNGVGLGYQGAVEVHQLPISNPLYLNDQLVSDCLLPEIDYSTTPPTPNRGKTVIGGGGTYLTRVICRSFVDLAATANWTTASTTLTVTTNPASPASVLPGMAVWNKTTGLYVGHVLTFVTTTLTLAVDPNRTGPNTAASAGSSGNILTFSCWTVA